MKTATLITALALSLSLTPVALLAQQEVQQEAQQEAQPQSEHEVHHPESTDQQEAESAPDQTDSAAANATLTIMQQRMEEMISHWDKMSQATDPAERQQLMLQHRQQMMALNTALRNMTQQPGMGQGMMGQGMGHGMMGKGMGQGMMGKGMMGKGMGQGMMGNMMGGMMGQGGQGIDCPMMGKRSGMHRCRGGMKETAYSHQAHMEAFEQLEKRVDLLQQMVEYLMQD